jgi:Na+-transporting methylmalonyl-CoA/oxaloacetate decarboxylase gamma subunit
MTTLAVSASSAAAPGTLAFLVVFGMAVILVFLFRSMSKHLRKVNAEARQQEGAKGPARASDLPKDS